MTLSLDDLEKRYSDIPYPEGKEERVFLIKDILSITPKEKPNKARCAQLLLDIFGDQVAIYESLQQQDERLIFNWIDNNWDEDDVESAGLLVSVLLHLQSKEVKDFLTDKKDESKSTEIKKVLSDAISELS